MYYNLKATLNNILNSLKIIYSIMYYHNKLSQFIRLSNRIVNIRHITRIDFSKDLEKYTIHMAQQEFVTQ